MHTWGGGGPLGCLLGCLGGDPKQHKNNTQTKSNFQTSKSRIHHVYGVPFGRPKSTKIDSKTSPKLRPFSKAKKMRFKSLLDASWAALGPFWPPCWSPQKRSGIGIRSTRAKFTFLTKICLQDTFWTQLGPSWPPKGPKMIPRWPPKTIQN